MVEHEYDYELEFLLLHRNPVRRGDKWKTFRYDDDRDIEEGDILKLVVTETEEHFGFADVADTTEAKIEEFDEEDFVGHTTSDTPEILARRMDNLYDDDIELESEVKMIVFDYYFG